MRIRSVLYVLPAVAVAGLALSAACSSQAKPLAAGATATSATSNAAGGAVHLTDYTDNDGPTSTVFLSGAVGDYGTAQAVNPDGSVDPDHRHQLNLTLTHGSFRLDIADLAAKFTTRMASFAVNTTTCSGTASVSAATPVVAGSGTGSYAGISGTFDLTITLDEVDKPTACSVNSAYLAQLIVITGSGDVTFG